MIFTAGDRVELLADYPDNNESLPAMSLGTVVEDNESSPYTRVAWDMDIGGHDCDGLCEWGHGWVVRRDRLALADREEIDDADIADLSEICAFIGI